MELSRNKRIFLNIAATYGRSLFGIVCALITGGWTYIALGEVDFGLYGVVGGLTSFVGFFNGILAGSISRFYAYSVGEAQTSVDDGLKKCQIWFNTAVTIHTVVPVILLIIGYPIGAYAVEHWLTIPPDRIQACIWIWRFACITCFVGMISVPFNAMYNAKQYIAELTIYSFCTTLVNLIFVAYMHYHPGNWFVTFALFQCLLGVLPQVIISVRAYMIFPECRFITQHMFSKEHLKQVFGFSIYGGMGHLCGLLRTQGMSVLTNIYFGPAMNSAMGIGDSIIGHTRSLAGSMAGAFTPAIANACGAKDYDLMRKMAFELNKIGTMLILFFALPIMLELPEILKLWLKNPPKYTTGLCLLALAISCVDSVSCGQMIAVNAIGKIKAYYIFLSSISIFTLPLAWGWVALGGNVYGMQSVLLFMIGLNTIGRVFFGRLHAGMSAAHWIKSSLIPLSIVTIVTCVVGYIPHLFMTTNIWRIGVTFIFTELAFWPLSWFILLNQDEKVFILRQINKIKGTLAGAPA